MRLLMGDTDGLEDRDDLSDGDLERLYAAPRTPWLRVNMISTVDGAATGDSGRSGSINNRSDKRVFDLLRAGADAIVVGAGTAEAEGYGPADVPIVLVSRRGRVPQKLRGAEPGRVVLATVGSSDGLEEARELLGPDNVWVLGSYRVDLAALKQQLADRGMPRILGEGGPHLLHDLLHQEVVDELTCTVTPRILAGEHPRITDGAPVDVPLSLTQLLEEGGTLLARWLVGR